MSDTEKELCKFFGLNDFETYIKHELDRLEDELYLSNLPSSKYIDIQARYDQMKQVRDEYYRFKETKKKN